MRITFSLIAASVLFLSVSSANAQQLTGRQPENFETMARRYIDDPSRIYPVVTIRTKAQAIGFLLKMLVTKAPDLDAWERDRGYPLLNDPVLAPDSAEWRATAERQRLNLLPAASSAAPTMELVAQPH